MSLSPEYYKDVYHKYNIDETLIEDLDVKNKIFYIKSDNVLNRYSSKLKAFINIYFDLKRGGEAKAWSKYFFATLKTIVLEYKPKAIFVTAPPFSIISLAIKASKIYKLPLIIDMRDAFSFWITQPYGSYLHFLITKRIEKKWFNSAQKVIGVTPQLINDFNRANVYKNKFVLINNGFDNEIKIKSKIYIRPNKKLIIGYVGSFYYSPQSRNKIFTKWRKRNPKHYINFLPRKEDWLYRSPYFVFKTISYLFKNKAELKEKILLKFVGIKPYWFDDMVNSFGLENNVSHLSWLSNKKAIEFQNSCDALLSTSAKIIDGEDYCIAGKTYEYITMNKPIIAFVAEGAQKQFIEKTGLGIICNPDNIEESANILKNVLDNGITLNSNIDFIKKYHRKNLTKQLSEIFTLLR